MRFWPPQSRQCLASRSTCLPRRFWRLSWRVTLLLATVVYSGAWLWAEVLGSRAVILGSNPEIHIERLEQAAEIFPLEHSVRERPAREMIRLRAVIPPQYIIPEIDAALRYDPYAADLLHDRKVLELRLKHE